MGKRNNSIPKTTSTKSVLATITAGPKGIVKAPPTREPRVKRNAEVKKVPRYFEEPVYRARKQRDEGGEYMHAIIGPGQADPTKYGSTPDPDTPATMRELLTDYPSFGWVAGHLLNDNLGGPGVARNLTPLTTAGNKNHLITVEQQIKNSITLSNTRATYHKGDEYFYGVDYEVTVSPSAWPDMPVFVTTHLIVSARVVRLHKQTGTIDDCPASDICAGTIYFAPIVDVLVDNTGYIAVSAVGGAASATASASV